MVDSTEGGDLLDLSGRMEGSKGQVPGGEVFVTTLGDADICRLGGYEGTGLVLSGGSFEGASYVNL